MFAPSPAVRPFAGGVPRRAAIAPSGASERASGKKRPRVAPARDSSAGLTKMTSVVTSTDMEVLTVGGEMPSQKLLQKRLASELDALRGILKKAELICQRGACKGGAPTAGKNGRFLASNQRPKQIEDGGGNAPLVKRRRISTLVEQKKKQIRAPQMSPEERSQLACRLSSLCQCGELPGHIVEFLQKQFGDADTHGEIEINMDTVEDSVLFELKMRLDKFAEESKDDKVAEESKDDKLAEEHKGEVVLELEEGEVETGKRPSSSSSGNSDTCGSKSGSDQIMGTSAQQLSEPAPGTAQSTVQPENVSSKITGSSAPLMYKTVNKVHDVQCAYMPGLLYRANLRRELMEMERAALPDESIHPRDLQLLGIAEYGHPSIMQQLGLVLKAAA